MKNEASGKYAPKPLPKTPGMLAQKTGSGQTESPKKVAPESASPSIYSVSNSASQNFRANAYASGRLWLKVSGATGMFNIANYTGSTWFSSVVYNELVSPLRAKFNELSRVIYEKLISNAALKGIAKSCFAVGWLVPNNSN